SPVPVTANTDYVVSYFAPQGHYSGDVGSFATLDRDVGPLLAAHSTPTAPNGVFNQPTDAFPTGTFQGTNYWVDAIFDTGSPAAPVITVGPSSGTPGQTAATITWTTDKPSDSLVEYGMTTSYGTLSALNLAQVTAHSVALTGLTAGTTYHYHVISRN